MKKLSYKQIENKIKRAKVRLLQQEIKENFGQFEVRKLESEIGNIYDYPYQERQKILTAINQFDSWCYNFDGTNYTI